MRKINFLKLLLRFWQKSHGEINYNGTDIEEIDTESLLEMLQWSVRSPICLTKPLRRIFVLQNPMPHRRRWKMRAGWQQSTILLFPFRRDTGQGRGPWRPFFSRRKAAARSCACIFARKWTDLCWMSRPVMWTASMKGLF